MEFNPLFIGSKGAHASWGPQHHKTLYAITADNKLIEGIRGITPGECAKCVEHVLSVERVCWLKENAVTSGD